jgi:hypothetical protein
MEKMAIFVEGMTEQAFVERLVTEIAGHHRVHVDMVQAHGGGRALPRTFVEVRATGPDPAKKYYVIIYDCGNDDRVLSDIRDRYGDLVSAGFRTIVGLRDVYPQPVARESDIRDAFRRLAPSTPIPSTLVLAVREIESWFIADHEHFQRMSRHMTPEAVENALGYPPATHDVTSINHPAEDLRRAYAVGRLGYKKSAAQVQRTVGRLDCLNFYLALPARIPDLAVLVRCIDEFLTQ